MIGAVLPQNSCCVSPVQTLGTARACRRRRRCSRDHSPARQGTLQFRRLTAMHRLWPDASEAHHIRFAQPHALGRKVSDTGQALGTDAILGYSEPYEQASASTGEPPRHRVHRCRRHILAYPAGRLPAFFPGFEAGSSHVHFKHALGSLVIALGLFAFAGFRVRPGKAWALLGRKQDCSREASIRRARSEFRHPHRTREFCAASRRPPGERRIETEH